MQRMCGYELKKMAEAAGLTPLAVCVAAGVKSPRTLYKVYKNEHVLPTTRARVEQAIRAMSNRAKEDSSPQAG